jgi:MFS family permease
MARFTLDRLVGGRLFRHPDFMRLWVGQTISEAGSQVTALALPTVAILLLHAGPFEVGLLGALAFLPFPVLGLIAGVYADRLKRRPTMIACDLGRMLALASVPIAFGAQALTIGQLYVVALLTGICNVFFAVSYQSYLPALIERADLVEGNSKLEVSRSVAHLSGPAVAGFLIQAIGAARAIWVDAASFLVSAVSIAIIRKPEPEPKPATETGKRGFWAEMGEGIRVVLRNATLWKIAGSTATSNLGSTAAGALFLIFAYRELQLSPATVGVIFAVGAFGSLAGALSAGAVARRLGLGPTLVISVLLGGLVTLAIPLALLGAPVAVLMATTFLASLGVPIYNINQVSLRQAITPNRVQGRMNATMRTIVWGTIPIGSFTGGVLGGRIGVVPTILVGGAVACLASLWILAGPVRLKTQPAPVG